MSSFVLRIARAVAVVLGLAFAAGAQAAPAATRFVDDDHVQCPFAGFRSITAALAVAGPGDTVRVCPGTYVEQVRMATPGVSVVGLTGNPAQAIVRPPDPLVGAMGALVEMSAPGTTLSAVTLQGKAPPLPTCGNAGRFTGVWIHHPPGPFAAASVVANVDIRQITHTNCDASRDVGVQIGGPTGGTRATVRNSRYMSDTSGILVKPNSQASIRDTVIAHPPDRGPTADVVFGVSATSADVDVERNIVSGFSLRRFGSELGIGIKLEFAHGTVGGGPGAGNLIRGNGIGLLVMESTDLTVSSNRVTLNRRWGIDVEGFPTRVGFARNVVTSNWQGPPEPGQPIVDCFDGTFTQPSRGENTWTDNIGGSSEPAGICTPSGQP